MISSILNQSSIKGCAFHVYYGVSKTAKATYTISFAFFKGIYDCATFPLRYVGAKNWSIPGVIIRTPYLVFKRIIGISSSGKTFKEELLNPGVQTVPQLLSQEQAKEHLKRLAMAAFAYSSHPDPWIKPFGYDPIDPRTLGVQEEGIQNKSFSFFDPKTGFKAVLAKKGDEIAIAFGAIGSDQSETPGDTSAHKKLFRNQNIGAVLNLAGVNLTLFQQADSLVEKLLKTPHFQNKKIVFVGQCLGGALAQFMALKYEKQGYCYNCLQIGAGLQWKLGDKALAQATRYVTHVHVQGDFLNNWKGQGIFDQVLSRLGLKTPGNFGTHYYVPSAYTKKSDIHNYCLGSVMKYLGFDSRTMPKELPESLLQ